MISPMGDENGCAMRVFARLVETSDDVYAYTASTDEEDVETQTFDLSPGDIPIPGVITATTGPTIDQDTGGAIVPRILFKFDPAAGASVSGYEWQVSFDGSSYDTGATIADDVDDGSGQVFGYVTVPSTATTVSIRVRALVGGSISEWREITGITMGFVLAGTGATAGLGTVTFTGDAPLSNTFKGVRIYRSTTNDFSAATLIAGTQAIEPGATFSVTAGSEGAVDLIVNGDFADGSGWTTGGDWVISGGAATDTPGTATSLSRSITGVTSGNDYRYEYFVSDRTESSTVLRLLSGSGLNQSGTHIDGHIVDTITATDDRSTVAIFGRISHDGTVDNFRMFEDGPEFVTQGQAYFWAVPVTTTNAEGAPSPSVLLTIP